MLERVERLETTLSTQLGRIEQLLLGNGARLTLLEQAVAGLQKDQKDGQKGVRP